MSSVHTDEAVTPVRRGAHFSGIDGLRAIAALAVLVSHVAAWTGLTSGTAGVGAYTARLGAFGVAVFFVISGFLLYRPYAASHLQGGPPPGTAKFYRRRFFRIFPPYWFALTAFVFVFHHASIASPRDAAQQYLLLQIYDANTVLAGLPQAWSLCVEISFYILLPGLAFLIARHGARLVGRQRPALNAELTALAVLYAIGVAFRFVVVLFVPSVMTPTSSWLLSTIDWFALGMALAVFSAAVEAGLRLPRLLVVLGERPLVAWLFAAQAYWLLIQQDLPRGFQRLNAAQFMGKHAFLGLAAVLLVLPAVLGPGRPSVVRRILLNRGLRWVGVASYSVFLWHVLWMREAAEWLDIPRSDGGFWLLLGATLALTLPWSALVYRLVEQPAMEWGATSPR
jgi:peptidoglycan/LPS O-acetylase OafA/YrhL